MTAAEQLKAIGENIGEARGIVKGEARGIVKGEAIGEARGEHKKAIETARNLKALKTLSNQQIADVTGLSLSEVEELEP